MQISPHQEPASLTRTQDLVHSARPSKPLCAASVSEPISRKLELHAAALKRPASSCSGTQVHTVSLEEMTWFYLHHLHAFFFLDGLFILKGLPGLWPRAFP